MNMQRYVRRRCVFVKENLSFLRFKMYDIFVLLMIIRFWTIINVLFNLENLMTII